MHTEWNQEEFGYAYGLHGTPTTLELATRIAELEGGTRTLLTPSGLAAIGVVDLAFLSAGSHVLIPENAYSPNRILAVKLLRRFGIEASFYPSEIGVASPNTSAPIPTSCGLRVRLHHHGDAGCAGHLYAAHQRAITGGARQYLVCGSSVPRL